MQTCLLLFMLMLSASGQPYKAKIVTIEIDANYSSFPFEIRKSGPAIRLALDHARTLYNNTLDLQWEFRPGSCGPERVTVVAAELYYKSGIDIFIGPGCSLAVEPLAHMANGWNVPIITPVGNAATIGDKTRFPRLTRASTFMQNQFVEMIIYLMNYFNWKHMYIFNDQDELFSSLVALSFDEVLKAQKSILWKRSVIRGATMTRESYHPYLEEASLFSRVIICVMMEDRLRELMLVAHDLGYTSGDYVFISVASVSDVIPFPWRKNDTEDEAALKAFDSVILLYLSPWDFPDFQKFKKLMINASLVQYGYVYGNTEPDRTIARYYESVMIYAQVLNETLAAGEDPMDGLALTRKMWNRTFYGMTGPVVLDEKGDRSADIAIVDMDPTSGLLEIVYIYHSDTRKLEKQLSRGISWPNNQGPPPDIPVCGYAKEKCRAQDASEKYLSISLGSVFVILFLMSLVLLPFIYRRWKTLKTKNLWWWRITRNEVTKSNMILGDSIISIQTRTDQGASKANIRESSSRSQETAFYKGQPVRRRPLMIKKLTVTNEILLEFEMMREIGCLNLVRVFGACLDEAPYFLVTEHCSKGTLQDLLGSSNFSLDAQFKISLANDVAEGLVYIHENLIKQHGRLSSSTCLIDSRFTVKLTDFGLPSLLRQEAIDTASQEYKRECLWRAPEILRGDAPSRGTREGDIYSFGIVLLEIVTRSEPYEHEAEFMSLDEILDRLRRGADPEFRPSVGIPANLNEFRELISSAWREDPCQRPTITSVKKQLKALAKKFGESGNFLDNLLRRMERYAGDLEKLVEEKTAELGEEKLKSETLLYQILPKDIAERLKMGVHVEPEHYESVTIYFSDIVGFTTLASIFTPMQVVNLLNDLYSTFDSTIESFDVYKVETIGDAYMVVSGLPHCNGTLHAQHIARMSLALLEVISVFKIRHRPEERLQLRIGIHSGPVCAGVVGLKMPRYCLFGDTVNTASRMESHGEGMKIHLSEATAAILRAFGTFDITLRGMVEIKGKGLMKTYWLLGERRP